VNKTIRISIALAALALAAVGCSKKAKEGGAGGAAAPKSGLAWTPINFSEMTPTCKKALACCEELAKDAGAKSAEDYNGKCSGPALWKDDGCETDLKARIAMLEADSKPVPAACK
jgi:hypothetical protein